MATYKCGGNIYTAGEMSDFLSNRSGDGVVEYRDGAMFCVPENKIVQASNSDSASGDIEASERTRRTERTPTGTRTVTEYENTQGGVTTSGTSVTNEIEDRVRWQNVYFPGRPETGGSRGYETLTVSEAENLPSRIRAEEGGTENSRYKDLEQGIKGYFGQSISSYTSLDAAWNRIVEDAQAGNVAAMDLLASGKQAFDILGDPSKRGRGSGAPSVTYSIDKANEEDIYTLAQGLAMEMIGRPITEKQFDKLLKRVRKEEQASPTITRRSGNTVTTEAGITTEERQSVMAELLQENPQWRQHQMSQGVLDALTRNIQEAKRLDSGV